jgi:hypothetical protein
VVGQMPRSKLVAELAPDDPRPRSRCLIRPTRETPPHESACRDPALTNSPIVPLVERDARPCHTARKTRDHAALSATRPRTRIPRRPAAHLGRWCVLVVGQPTRWQVPSMTGGRRDVESDIRQSLARDAQVEVAQLRHGGATHRGRCTALRAPVEEWREPGRVIRPDSYEADD